MRFRNPDIAAKWARFGIAFLILAALPLILLAGLPRGEAKPHYDKMETRFAPIQDVPNPFRKIAWLNGNWQFRTTFDPEWRQVAVPHVWNSIPGLEYFNGPAEYKIKFKIPEDWKVGRVTLHFGAIGGRAQIVVNGVEVANSNTRFIPVDADVTGAIDWTDENTVEVRIDNRQTLFNPDYMISEKKYAGIFREVYVELSGPVRFENLTVRALPGAEDGATASVSVESEITTRPDEKVNVIGSVARAAGADANKIVFDQGVNADSQGRASLEWRGEIPDAELWSPGNPAMYRVSLVVVTSDGATDGIERRFGIRKFVITKKGFELNGTPVRINGVVWHEQFPGGWGPLATRAEIEKDLDLIRAGGFNAVRFTHPAHTAALDACDRLGLLVFEELPFKKRLPKGDKAKDFLSQLEKEMYGMARRDGRHPSIVAWGLGSGLDGSDGDTMKAVVRLRERLLALDRGRAVYAGIQGIEPSALPSDIGFSAFSEDASTREAMARIERELLNGEAAHDLPLVALAFGAPADPGRPGGAGLFGTEMNQYYVVARLKNAFERSPRMAGWFVDGLADYEGEWLDPRGRANTVRTGIVTADRRPKLIFQMLSVPEDAKNLEWKWSRAPFRFPTADFALAALFLIVGITIWSGFSKMWPAYAEPDLLGPVEDELPGIARSFAMYGLPMLLVAGAAASFAAAALMDACPPDPAALPESAVRAAYLWLTPGSMRLASLFVAQFVWLLAAAVLAAAALGDDPLRVFELMSRCTALRICFVLIPFFPASPVVPAALILGWEVYMQTGVVSREYGISTTRATVIVLGAHAAIAAVALAVAFRCFGSIGFLF
jgi:hypothetical protein